MISMSYLLAHQLKINFLISLYLTMRGVKISLSILFLEAVLESCIKTFFPCVRIRKERNILQFYHMLFFFSCQFHMTARLNFSTIFNKLGTSLVQGRKRKGLGKMWHQRTNHFSQVIFRLLHCISSASCAQEPVLLLIQ